MFFSRLGVSLGAVFLATGLASAQEPTPMEKLVAAQGKLCFARVYEPAHLAAHLRQKVERLFFLIGKNRASAYWEDPTLRHSEASPNKFAHPDAEDSEHERAQVAALVTLRGRAKPENVSGWCSSIANFQSRAKKLLCGGECDHQIGYIRSDGDAHLVLDGVPEGVLQNPEAGVAEESALTLGADDKSFRLERRPLEDCVAEANKTNSRYASLGAPLRERLKADQSFCFGRDYSAQHLLAHPQQATTSIRVLRDAGQIAADRAKNLLADWPDGAGVAVSVTTRAHGAAIRMRYVCTPVEDQWECSAALCKAGRSDCTRAEIENTKTTGCDSDSERTIYLRRGEKDFMMLGNANVGLPLDGFCAEGGKTKSDDKVYRLDPLPLSACENR
ncbi:MAG TPA: hypothetical protein VEH76_13275 [Methylocystis sp.]|nr:hypothetical protein [Methylocystis sp.]